MLSLTIHREVCLMKVIIFVKFVLYLYPYCMCRENSCATKLMWRSEDTSWQCVCCFYYVIPDNWTLVSRQGVDISSSNLSFLFFVSIQLRIVFMHSILLILFLYYFLLKSISFDFYFISHYRDFIDTSQCFLWLSEWDCFRRICDFITSEMHLWVHLFKYGQK